MPVEVIMPKLSMTMEEGTLLRWFKAEGEPVRKGEPLFEVMTDKINMEVESPADGILRGVTCREGETRPVLTVIAYIVGPGESVPAAPAAPAPAAASAPVPAAVPAPIPAPAPVSGGPVPGPSRAPAPASGNGTSLPVRATPAVRRLARELGVDLTSLRGSGPHGRVVPEDVLAAAAALGRTAPGGAAGAMPAAVPVMPQAGGSAGAPPVPQPEGPAGAPSASQPGAPAAIVAGLPASPPAVPLSGPRRVIAERLGAIWQAAPHVTLHVSVDMAEARDVYGRLAAEAQARGTRLTWTGFIAFAAVRALRDVPRLNATLGSEGLRTYPAVHLGVAVDRPEGLIVPVIRDADRLGLLALSDAIAAAAERARSGKLSPAEVEEGTFTITNLGMFGIESFTPVLNPPQVAILGVNAIQDRVVAYQGQPAVRPVLGLSLSIDHRALDGADGARYLQRLRELLEVPWRLLL